MPSLRLFYDSFSRPLVTVEVKPALLLQPQYQATPPNVVPCVKESFLVDTGAPYCIIDDRLVRPWNLPKNMPIVVRSGAHGRASGHRYPLALRLSVSYQADSWYHPVWPIATATDSRFDDQDFKGIIGMDLLRLGSFSYTGSSHTCQLSWP
jgi:hypothetical protein